MANEMVNRTGSLSLTPDEIKKAGTATATTDFLELTNTGNASSMTGTGTAILFNQYYYSATAPAEADAGRIVVKTEGNWTSTGSTQDATMAFQLAENGTVADKMTISSAGTVTATTFTGTLAGSAATVTVVDESSDTSCFPLFATAATGSCAAYTDASALTYNASTGDLGATKFTATSTVQGADATLVKAGTAASTVDYLTITNTVNNAAMTATGTGVAFNQWYYDAVTPAIADSGRIVVRTEGNWTSTASTQDATMAIQLAENGTVADKMTISSAGTVTATTFSGALSGAATAVTAANEATDTTCFPLFVTAATGDLGPKTNGSFEFNSNTGELAVNYLSLKAQSGAAQDRALLMGYGTSASPATWSTADKSAVEFRLKSTASSGTAYGVYIGMEGAAASEHIPVRGRCYLTGTTSNAHGGAFTIEDDGTSGKITGLGTGLRANWVLGDAAQEAGGTYYGAQAEIYCNGSNSDPSPVTRYACLCIGANGDATGAARVKNAIAFESTGADATTNMIYSHDHSPGNAAGSIRVLVNGVARYLKFWAAE